jgi:lipid A biosynthesis lauroyl/palmitoleoyl acyltransferase
MGAIFKAHISMSQTHTSDFQVKDFLAPKYWLTWLGLGMLRACSYLPYSWLLYLGTGLGWLGFYLMPGRRRITRTNVRLAFPELDEQTQRKVVKQSFYSATTAIFESALAWWGSDKKLKPLYRIEGLEHVQAAIQSGKGVLLLGGHYTTVEISGRLLAYCASNVFPTYKRAHNRLFEAVMTQQRRRVSAGLIKSSDMRGILRCLKDNNIVWFAPDQDFGIQNSVFAPFMGIPTATLTITARLAKRSGAAVLPFYSERLANNKGYLLRVGAPLVTFPCGDDVANATTINHAIEDQVRRTPAQYLWGHRRFKTRPHGDALFYKPRRDSSLRKYSLLLGLLSLPAFLYTAWQAWRYDDRRYLTERLGLAQYTPGPFDIWLHAASVGEVNAVLPLVELIARQHPHLSLLFTVNTPTGGMTARNKLPANVVFHYMPIDWQFAVERFTAQVKPRALLITETEVWPNLYLHCLHKGIHLTIINGRLANRMLSASRWIKRVYCRALEEVYWILARSAEDRDNFLAMGAKQRYLKVIGNIKFSTTGQSKVESFSTNRPYVLAASTRDGEERMIAECWKKLSPERRFLIIVPRHPKRLSHILRDLKSLDMNIAIRSRNEPITENTQIYLADTFGELTRFIAGSQFVIMGGSLKPFGGQNILEVARAGKGVIFGPYMDNFSHEATLFVQHEAGLQVKTDTELCTTIARLLSEPERAESLGKNGLGVMEETGDMAERYMKELEVLLPVFHSKSKEE